MASPTITRTRPAGIHEFYESLGKLREVDGYVRMSFDKLEGIRGDLFETDDTWQDWDFLKLVDSLRK